MLLVLADTFRRSLNPTIPFADVGDDLYMKAGNPCTSVTMTTSFGAARGEAGSQANSGVWKEKKS